MRTRHEIEKTARVLSKEERWDIWTQCGVHKWQALPRTESGEHHCPTALIFARCSTENVLPSCAALIVTQVSAECL
jgi:hypothetical protein